MTGVCENLMFPLGGGGMKSRLITVTIVFSMVILLAAGLFYMEGKQKDTKDQRAQQIIAVNELEQLALKGDTDQISEKSEALQNSLRASEISSHGDNRYFIICAVAVCYIILVFGYIYFSILRPFDKMKGFAKEIAQGNFDVPLQYERSNYFGDFTWAFDSMRKEITRSRACEKEAVENNKTVIATLSHDIKTPIASLRAYAEGLEANMDRTAERRQKYISIIIKKCDEVARLTNDLFLHSISDLDKLKISMEQFELCGFLSSVVHEISTDSHNVRLRLPEEKIMVLADKNRMMQVCENLINNAGKYAKTDMDLSVSATEECVRLSFRDYGNGIADEDLPFVFGKFYRGKNCGSEQGSGLGLYIVKYIVEKMNGEVLLHNHKDGLEVVIQLPLCVTI